MLPSNHQPQPPLFDCACLGGSYLEFRRGGHWPDERHFERDDIENRCYDLDWQNPRWGEAVTSLGEGVEQLCPNASCTVTHLDIGTSQ